jgi:DNA-binding transcriptional LysR family regulator
MLHLLHRLKSALALAEAGTFRRAAQRLGISQPHLTRIIKSLEGDLGIILFGRGPQGITVTPEGHQVLREAAVLVTAESVFTAKIEALRNKSSETLRIAVGAFISQSWAGTAVTAMKATDPEISISLRELDWWKLADAVQDGEFDLAIGEMSEANSFPEIAKEPFPEREGSIIVRASHPLAGRRLVTLEDIAGFPLAGPRLPARVALLLPPACALGSLSKDGRFFLPNIECATPRSMIDVVSATDAVCMLWPEFCTEKIQSGALVELPFRPTWLHTGQGIMYQRNPSLSPAALRFRFIAKSVERRYFQHRLPSPVLSGETA